MSIAHVRARAVPALPLEAFGADLLVPLVTGERARYVNLDCAASPPCARAAGDAVTAALPWYSSVHRGAGFASAVSTALLESSRRTIGAFVGARPDDAVILTRNTTEALNLLAAALPEDTAIVAFASEHHANLLPWRARRCIVLAPPRSHDEAVDLADGALRALPPGHRLLAVTGASNVTGELWPIARMCAVARRNGARVAIDAAQLAAHRSIDVAALDADWVAFSSHKLHAPFGCGALVGRADWLDTARPWLLGGGAARRVSNDAVEWADSPSRHEAGTPNLLGAVAFAAACGALTGTGWESIEEHESALLERLLQGLRALPGIRILSIFGAQAERIGIVSFTVRHREPALLSAALSAEHAIGVRDGAFCAHPLVAALTGPTRPEPALRASFGAASRSEDIDRFLSALDSILARGPRWRYARQEGRFVPDPDPRPPPDPGLGLEPLAAVGPCGTRQEL